MTDERDPHDPDIYSGELTHDADLGPETDDTDSADETQGETHE
jgi:hypothetical protein